MVRMAVEVLGSLMYMVSLVETTLDLQELEELELPVDVDYQRSLVV